MDRGEVRALGMAVLEKNDPEQAARLQPFFDGVLDEQCNQYNECAAFAPYLRAHKPVLDAEYKRSLYPSFCAADSAGWGSSARCTGWRSTSMGYRPCIGLS